MLRVEIGHVMEHIERLKISAVMTTIAVGIGVVLDIISPLDVSDIIFSPVFVVPVFVASFLLAPAIGKFVKYK